MEIDGHFVFQISMLRHLPTVPTLHKRPSRHLESWTGHFSLTSDFFKSIVSSFVICLNKVD